MGGTRSLKFRGILIAEAILWPWLCQDRDLPGERTRALLQEGAPQHAFLAALKKIGQHLLCVSEGD